MVFEFAKGQIISTTVSWEVETDRGKQEITRSPFHMSPADYSKTFFFTIIKRSGRH